MKARGGTGAVRDGRGEFDAERNREAAIGARSAPPSAADSSAGSHSSATGSIPAGGGVCGRGRARKEKVRTWGAEARRGPEHMTRAGACPAAGGRQRARSAPKHNAPRRGGCFAKGVCASAQAPVRSWTEDEGWRRRLQTPRGVDDATPRSSRNAPRVFRVKMKVVVQT